MCNEPFSCLNNMNRSVNESACIIWIPSLIHWKMNWIRANLRYWYVFIKIVFKQIKNLFVSFSLAWPRCKWCCDCSFYGQLAQAHVGYTQNHSTRGCLSTGHCTAKHWNATCRLSVHLWYEFVQIFQFRLRSVAEDFNIVEGKCAMRFKAFICL